MYRRYPRVYGLTYKGKEMVEMTMRLDEENLCA